MRIRTNRRSGALTALSVLTGFCTQTVCAADADAGDAGLAEVVVTANKLNAQKVLDVPASMQAISGDALVRLQAAGIMDIAGTIPGLSIQDLGPGDKKYVIRGINSTGDSTTGIYYGEAVISGSNANDGGGFNSDVRLYDLDHVEVLRGPQGTLYGASSMSGTIRFIPKSPNLNTLEGYVTAEGSETQHASGNYNVNGAINLPILENTLALRMVGWKVYDSGYINQTRVGSGVTTITGAPANALGFVAGVNNDDVSGGRAMLRFQPNDNLTIDANFTAQTETADGSSRYTPAGVTSWGTDPVPPATTSAIPRVKGCDLCNLDVTQSPWSDNLKVFGLTVAYKSSVGTVTATTNQYNRRLGFEFDSTPILVSFGVPVPAETVEPQVRKLNSTELRFASDLDFPVNFVTGVYRQSEKTHWDSHVITTDGSGFVTGPFSSADADDALAHPGVGDTFFGQADQRSTTQWAGFGEATWKVDDRFTLVGGLRYFSETLNGVQESTHPFGGFGATTPVGPIHDPTQTFNKFTYKINGSYRFNEAALAYATVSTGFRSGGLNQQSEPFEPIPKAFSPDTLTNYEAGSKGMLFGGLLEYQADLYLIKWKNIQVSETTADGAFPYVGNAGAAQVKGVELELAARPFEYFTATLAGSYQDAHLTDGATPQMKAANPTLGLTGESIPNVPKFQMNLGLNYTQPVMADWKGMIAADLTYRGAVDSYFASNTFNIPLASYTLVNLRLGVLNDLWTVTAFARNLANKRAEVSAINSSQDPYGFLTVRPRTIGISVTRRF